MKFLVDNQLPLALSRWIKAQGVDAVHVIDLGFSEKEDLYLWQFATREERIVVSKDEDFFNLANRPHDKGRLLWCRLGNFRKGELIRQFEGAWPEIIETFKSGQRIIEFR